MFTCMRFYQAEGVSDHFLRTNKRLVGFPMVLASSEMQKMEKMRAKLSLVDAK